MVSMNGELSVSQASSPSRISRPAPWLRWAGHLRLGAGPLAIAGFFLPWAHGPGPFAANEFTGFTLVGFAGRLQALDLSVAEGSVLWAIRLLILGVVISGAWQLLLAPAHRGHLAYPASGWYLVGAAGVCLGIGAVRSGLSVPPVGLVCLSLAAVCFAAAYATDLLPERRAIDSEDPAPGH